MRINKLLEVVEKINTVAFRIAARKKHKTIKSFLI